jgi:hypothetical protein
MRAETKDKENGQREVNALTQFLDSENVLDRVPDQEAT